MIFLNLLVLFIPLSKLKIKPPLFFRKLSPNFFIVSSGLSHNCTILSSQVFDNFVLADELFPKLYEALKLASQLMIIYMEN